MEHIWKKNSLFIVKTLLTMIISMMIVLVYTIFTMTSYNKTIVTDLAINTSNINMKETIDNLVIRIEYLQNDIHLDMQSDLLILSNLIKQNENSDIESLLAMVELYHHKINTIIVDMGTHELLYESTVNGHKRITRVDDLEYIKNDAVNFEGIELGQYYIALYINWDDIHDVVKTNISTEIHNMQYEKNQYVWVHEIINYDGGEDYAIRLIHPNLVDTEGQYLSTNTQDIVGDFPYLTELNGVKEHGEIFYHYYFQEMETDTLTKKISYSKLYEEYDWIISTGVPLNDLDTYYESINKASISFFVKDMILVGVIFFAAFLGGVFLVMKSQKKYLSELEAVVRQETERDVLTNAFSRKFGDNYLKKSLENFMNKGINSNVFILDMIILKPLMIRMGMQ